MAEDRLEPDLKEVQRIASAIVEQERRTANLTFSQESLVEILREAYRAGFYECQRLHEKGKR